MATVEMSFTPLPAHVRTARLVATAVARRSGVDEALLDEVRLAVGEACSRAVEAHQEFCPREPVRVALTGANGRFEVVVTDHVAAGNGTPAGAAAAQPGSAADGTGQPAGGGASEAPRPPPVGPAELGLAVIEGLADDVDIARTKAGVTIRMSWPTAGPGIASRGERA
ncbi:MAG TPA: ATP-binding protein [Streptosporangiaceae bacterium]|jgi:anti-sigma regulatory factor (Ser/Thr protein kinase)|nr:ATP-binding protein [Streptosporangiaceae bacterium]